MSVLFTLAAGWAAADLSGDLVLLNEAEGEYLCLPQAKAERSPNGWRAEPEVFAALGALGALSQIPRAPPAEIVLPRRALAPPPAPPSALQAARLTRAWLASAAACHRRPFRRLLADARRRAGASVRRPTLPQDHLARELSAFAWIQPWLPWQGACLQRCLLLLHLLPPRSGVRWVFGVRTWPFAAHCWLQLDDLVLDDDLDRVRSYAPLLQV
jgi:hypothetical protein